MKGSSSLHQTVFEVINSVKASEVIKENNGRDNFYFKIKLSTS